MLYNNTPRKAIVNAASNITYRPLIEADNRGRWYRPLYFNKLTHFWDKVDIVYVMHFSDYYQLLFEQWIIFKYLVFISSVYSFDLENMNFNLLVF
jgi:hypothetical protein